MNLTQRIDAFATLGDFLLQFASDGQKKNLPVNEQEYDFFAQLIERSASHNSWFTPDTVRYSLEAIAQWLHVDNLNNWLKSYTLNNETTPKRIGVILAGNIPLVGFQDMLCVLISGHTFVAKMSAKDDKLIKGIARVLTSIAPKFGARIVFEDGLLKDFAGIIATGSNNSSRYFEYYFGKYPHIIRKNRNSVAILSGNETAEELSLLAEDIFIYYGLGCRNVSKLYVPEGYNFTFFFESIQSFSEIGNHFKYANNYDYNKSIYLINGVTHLDNGFLLLSENTGLSSPISVLHYETYTHPDTLPSLLGSIANEIQCVVSHSKTWKNSVTFGQAQKPSLTDYADGVDTMEFLIKLS